MAPPLSLAAMDLSYFDTSFIYGLLVIVVLVVASIAIDRYLVHRRSWQRRMRSRHRWFRR